MFLNTNDLLKYYDNDIEKRKIIEESIDSYRQEIIKQIPNYDLFLNYLSGKEYGEWGENQIINSFNDIKKYKDTTEYDAEFINCIGPRIEIKCARMLFKTGNGLKYIDRIMPKNFEYKWKTSAKWEQVKPEYADWFVLHMLFGDGDCAYLFPSSLISKTSGSENKEEGKFTLSIQHSKNKIEGQLSITKKFIENSDIFLMDGYSFNNENDNLEKYIKIVVERLKQNNIDVPDKLLLKK